MSKADSPTKLCVYAGCTRPLRARGLCSTHYNHAHQPNRHHTERSCEACDTPYVTTRTDGRFCSLMCRDYARWGPRSSSWPRHIRQAARAKPAPFCEQRNCAWCGQGFTARRDAHVMCSLDCKRKAKAVRRRGRETGAPGTYTWAEVTRLFLAFDRCCAYCRQPVVGQPDPDHVVPLSRGGANSLANILPACRACNSDKRDLLIDEWVQDRARRLLPSVVTTWRTDDPRYWHLTVTSLAA